MNYYEKHLGDYAKQTRHLSMLEHGAYNLLLDRYYATEEGIPADQAHRLAGARTKEERDAVDAVLAEFFTLKDGVWIKNRVEEEIASARHKIETARQNGRGGGRPKSKPNGIPKANQEQTQEKPTGFPVGNPEGTQGLTGMKALQSPDTRHQTPDTQLLPSARDSEAVDTRARDLGGAATVIPISAAGEACKAMREAGMLHTNPSHPHLLAAIAEGVTPQELADLVREFPGKPMSYVVGAARGRRSEPRPVSGILPAKPVRRLNLITAEEAEALERERGDVHAAH